MSGANRRCRLDFERHVLAGAGESPLPEGFVLPGKARSPAASRLARVRDGEAPALPADPVCRVRRLLSLGGMLALAGCASMGEKSTTASLTLRTAPDTNPSPSGQPAPVAVRIYALRGDGLFSQIDFNSLYNQEAAALGSDLIFRRELIVPPASIQEFEESLPKDTNFLGVIAAFRDIVTARWRVVLPIEAGQSNIAVIEIGSITLDVVSMMRKANGWL